MIVVNIVIGCVVALVIYSLLTFTEKSGQSSYVYVVKCNEGICIICNEVTDWIPNDTASLHIGDTLYLRK